jgi:hypothetical protein
VDALGGEDVGAVASTNGIKVGRRGVHPVGQRRHLEIDAFLA